MASFPSSTPPPDPSLTPLQSRIEPDAHSDVGAGAGAGAGAGVSTGSASASSTQEHVRSFSSHHFGGFPNEAAGKEFWASFEAPIEEDDLAPVYDEHQAPTEESDEAPMTPYPSHTAKPLSAIDPGIQSTAEKAKSTATGLFSQ